MRFTIFQDSRLGDRRDNQDRVGYAYGRDKLLMVVADGMGGHLHGEIAAQVAVAESLRLFGKLADGPLPRPAKFLVALLEAAHRAIVGHARAQSLSECPRTTCVACLVQDGSAWWAHAGDSRLYVLRGGQAIAATRDHSLVQQLVDAGLLRPEAALAHPDRNKIYSCLGGDGSPVIDAGGPLALAARDTILLSTDGFWGQLPTPLLGERLSEGKLLARMPALLTEAQQLARGASDNLSVIAMTWETREDAPGRATERPPAAGAVRVTAVGDTTLPGGPLRPDGEGDEEFERVMALIRAAERGRTL